MGLSSELSTHRSIFSASLGSVVCCVGFGDTVLLCSLGWHQSQYLPVSAFPCTSMSALVGINSQLSVLQAHQIWGFEAPRLTDYRDLCVKPPKPGSELLRNYRTRGKNLLKQLRQWDNESKFGSSEDSEMDRYSSDYSGGSPLLLN
ncbi:Uncharacterized protein C4orf51 homolog [Lemmus lemmus]